MALHNQLIANRFVRLESSGAGIKARDQDTAQTVLLVDAPKLDSRLVGIFHPALVSIFAIVDHQGQRLAASEFVQGRSLMELFHGEPCHPKRAAEIVAELADGAAELHARGLVHGNITQASAILTAKGKARLRLMSAIGGDDEMLDVNELKVLFKTIGGHPGDAVNAAQSAAVLAATLR